MSAIPPPDGTRGSRRRVSMQPMPAAALEGAGRWSWARVASAPHRLGFFAGAVLLAVMAVWWLLALLAAAAGVPLHWAVAAPAAHALAMTAGALPLFMVGFLFTAGPRWLALPEVDARALRPATTTLVAGWALALVGFHVDVRVAAVGAALAAAGWSAHTWRFAGLLRASPTPDKLHPALVAAACTVGALALWGAAAALAFDDVTGVRAASRVALWGFVAPVFAIVSHRMLPFFTASALPFLDAWRPRWLLAVMLAALVGQLPLALAELWWWPLPGAVLATQAALEALAALVLLVVAVRWGLVQSLSIRLLAMLHAGFVWFGMALALSALSHAWLAASGGAHSLGHAPLHALTLGYLGATLFAMATRVSAGHSGRPLAADDLAWTLYWLVQAAALLRVAGALWDAHAGGLVVASAASWAVATIGWGWRYGGWLGRPRADGRPG
ncbi:MAG TPA: NnrS family protein [Burkholderiaceae bacterium]|nr:NnrS family protein [Burkholderiaceae bacterium]